VESPRGSRYIQQKHAGHNWQKSRHSAQQQRRTVMCVASLPSFLPRGPRYIPGTAAAAAAAGAAGAQCTAGSRASEKHVGHNRQSRHTTLMPQMQFLFATTTTKTYHHLPEVPPTAAAEAAAVQQEYCSTSSTTTALFALGTVVPRVPRPTFISSSSESSTSTNERAGAKRDGARGAAPLSYGPMPA
ncbi:unnamed protein product, partial [Laminaria digitata]